MLYAQTGVHALSAVSGCPGHTYDQRADLSDPHMSVHGCAHEEHLKRTKDPLWAASPADVPLTEAEKKRADAARHTFDQVAAQSVDALARLLASGGLSAALAAVPGQAPAAAAPPPPAPAAARARSTRARRT